MAYSANSFPNYPYLASPPYYDANTSVWGPDAQVATSTPYTQNFDHGMHHEEPTDAPLTQFQKSVREEDERFYAMFPEARPQVNQWRMVQLNCNELWDGVGFQYTPPQYPLTSTETVEPTPPSAVPPYTNELPATALVPGTSTSLHYNYDLNFSPHDSVHNATQDTEIPQPGPSSQAWAESVQSPPVSEPEVYDQSYNDVKPSFNAFPSPSLEGGLVHHPTPHQDSHSLVSNEPFGLLPDPASSPREVESPPYQHASPLDLPFATTSDQQFFEEHSYESPPASGDWSTDVAPNARRQLAPAPTYHAEALFSDPTPSSSKSPAQRQVGVHRHERRHSHARIRSPTPHRHARCSTPNRQSSWPLSSQRSPSPSVPLSPASQAKRLQEKKPPLACLFCRGRKIACGPPIAGTTDKTCNQCQRRSLKCEYPSESRRGMRKKKGSVNANGPKVTVKGSKS